MALQKTITLEDSFGLAREFQDAYIKVEQTYATNKTLDAVVRVYDCKDGKMLNEKMYNFEPNLSGENFIKQSYLLLKQTDEYADAEDV